MAALDASPRDIKDGNKTRNGENLMKSEGVRTPESHGLALTADIFLSAITNSLT